MKHVYLVVVAVLVSTGWARPSSAQDNKQQLREKILHMVEARLKAEEEKILQEVKGILDKELGKAPDRNTPQPKAKKKGYLGVHMQQEPMDEALRKEQGLGPNEGIRIEEIEDGSAAEKAGLEADDIIVSINAKKIGNFDELKTAVTGFMEGDTVELGIVRNKERKTIKAVLGFKDEEEEKEE